MDPVVLCRFPFLGGTADFVRKYGPPAETLLHSPDYEEVRHEGFLEVMAALGGAPRPEAEVVDEADALRELLRYIVARIIVSHVGDRGLARRFAVHEAARMKEHLESAGDEVFRAVAGELDLDLRETELDGEPRFAVHFGRYLELASDRIGGPGGEWKLVNRPVSGGDVLLRRGEVARLAMEAMVRRLESDTPARADRPMVSSMAEHVKRVREAVARMKAPDIRGAPDIGRSPPCIGHLLADVSAGANLPHHARFTLVTYLNAIGMAEEDMLKTFAVSPDFDDRIARYQVEHITGTLSGTEYSVPKCTTLQTYGVCRDRDLLCAEIVHPVQYYRARRARKDFGLSARLHRAMTGKPVTGPPPVSSEGTTGVIDAVAIGKWYEGELSVRDVRGRRAQVEGAWHTAALARLSGPDGPVETLTILDWNLALALHGRVGGTARVRGFVTSSGDGPLLHLVKAL